MAKTVSLLIELLQDSLANYGEDCDVRIEENVLLILDNEGVYASEIEV
jgi:hypothetical protein